MFNMFILVANFGNFKCQWGKKIKKRSLSLTVALRCLIQHQKKISSSLTQDTTQLLAQAMVISRILYCNAFLTGAPNVMWLQIVQTASKCLVFKQPKHAHITPLLM